MDNICQKIKESLQDLYDIPFKVSCKDVFTDLVYTIIPENDLEELFEITITIKQAVRMIIEIFPQKYAARMLCEMKNADEAKRHVFVEYVHLFQKKAKTDFILNQIRRNEADSDFWRDDWKQFKLRATQILDEVDKASEDYLIEWSKLAVGLMMALLTLEDVDNEQKYLEGKVSQVLTNKYERNPANRELCLAANGYLCKICGFDFEDKYGKIGYKFIHVHHIQMVSSFGREYYLDPVKDLIPVCPNCHAMLHRTNPPMKPEELKELIRKQQNGDK